MSMLYSKWNSQKTMAVCHVPKAMGSWLRKELLNGLGPERLFKPVATFVGQNEDLGALQEIRQRGVRQFSLIEGHFPLSEQHLDAFSECYFITCVRSPVDLLRSHLNYVGIQMGTHPLEPSLASLVNNEILGDDSPSSRLAAFYNAYPYVFDNTLTRYLSGVTPERILIGGEASEAVAKAIDNIDSRLHFIFIDKYLEQSCDLFYELTNVRISSTSPVNSSPAMNWIYTKAVFAQIAETVFWDRFKLDSVVYEHAVRRFIQTAASKAEGAMRCGTECSTPVAR